MKNLTSSDLDTWIQIILGVITIIGSAIGFFKWILPRIFFCFSAQKKLDNSSIAIVPQNTLFPELATWWCMGSNAGKPAMRVVGDFLVTNLADKATQLTGAELKKSKTRGQVLVKELDSPYSRINYQIPPGCTTDIRIVFWIEPPIKKIHQTFFDDVAVIDQAGKKYWIKNIQFKYT